MVCWKGCVVDEHVIDVLGDCRVESGAAGAAGHDGDVFGGHFDGLLQRQREDIMWME